jgi:hypothetical protein
MLLGRSTDDVRAVVQNWFSKNKVGVVDNQPTYIKGRWGTGFLTAAKYFQVTFQPTADGVIAKTEGWISAFGLSEIDFSPTALGGGIPRREGWRAMENLWRDLQSFSKPPRYCRFCGKAIDNATFCPYCGKQLT